MYLSYEYYKDEYGGTLLTPDNFKKHVQEADDYADYVTMGRLQEFKGGVFDPKIKRCLCALAETYKNEEDELGTMRTQASKSGIKSETVGSHTVSFHGADNQYATKLHENYNNMRYAITRKYLIPTGLMYRGL